MKILELHYSTSWAGAERFVVDLSNELSKTQEVILCTIEDDDIPQKSYYKKEINTKVKYINLKCKTGLQIKALWRIYKIIKKENPDIVHAHTDLICIFLPALLLKKIIFFHTLHSLADVCLRKKYLKPIYAWFYRNKIKPITISDACYNSFKILYGENNSIKIDNGRSPLNTTNNLIDVHKEIEGFKLHDDDKVFIHVARCQPEKNQKLLIDSFNIFLRNNYHGILIIIGDGYDKPENKYLLDIKEKGIYWVGTKNNVGDYLSESDFFILSSKYEGLPISLLEAMSYGVIPICTPVGGIPNVINNNSLGYLSKSEKVEDFYIAIRDAFEKYEDFNKSNLVRCFNEKYSMEFCAKNYLNYFKKSRYDKE